MQLGLHCVSVARSANALQTSLSALAAIAFAFRPPSLSTTTITSHDVTSALTDIPLAAGRHGADLPAHHLQSDSGAHLRPDGGDAVQRPRAAAAAAAAALRQRHRQHKQRRRRVSSECRGRSYRAGCFATDHRIGQQDRTVVVPPLSVRSPPGARSSVHTGNATGRTQRKRDTIGLT